MIAQNSEVYNPPTYLFSLYTYMEKDLCRGVVYFTVLCDHPCLVSLLLLFWYPYILLHFQMFFITCVITSGTVTHLHSECCLHTSCMRHLLYCEFIGYLSLHYKVFLPHLVVKYQPNTKSLRHVAILYVRTVVNVLFFLAGRKARWEAEIQVQGKQGQRSTLISAIVVHKKNTSL